jgi:antirestriction protein ArdC
MGHGGGEGAARPAIERLDRPDLFRDQRVALVGAVIERGFSGQSWLTFRQALSLGGNVMKGECGTTVAYADRFVRRLRAGGREAARSRDRRGCPGNPVPEALHDLQYRPVRNLPEDVAAAAPPVPTGLIEPRDDALIEASGIDFRIGGQPGLLCAGA